MKGQWIRRVAIAAGVLAAGVVIVAVAIVATFDSERVEAAAVEWMRAQHERTLAIDGPLSLSVFPRPAVRLRAVRLSERGRPEPFLTADEVALALSWPAVWRRELAVDRLGARGVAAALHRDARGVLNVEDFVSSPGAGAAPPAGASPRPGIDAVELEDLRLQVRDGVCGLEGEIAVPSLTASRLGAADGAPVSLRARLRLQRPWPADLAIDAAMALGFDPAQGASRVSGLKLQAHGDAAALTGLGLRLEGNLAWDGQRFQVQDLALATTGRRGTAPFELSLSWPRLAVTGGQVEGSALSGQAQWRGPTAVTARFRSAAPGGTTDLLRLPGIELTVEGGDGTRRLDGRAGADLLLAVRRGDATFEKLELSATLADAGRPPLALAVRGSAGAGTGGARWAVQGALDGAHFEGKGQIALGAAVPRLQADARFDRLDLNRLLPPGPVPSVASAASVSTAATTPTAAPGAEHPLPFERLGLVDGRVSIEAGSLAFRQFRLSRARLEATLDGGTLRVARFDARAWGGSVGASGVVDGPARRVALKMAADGVDVQPMLEQLFGRHPLEGTARIAADLRSGGANAGALRDHLEGAVSLQVRDGAVRGLDLVRALQQAAAGAPARDASGRVRAGEKTEFVSLTASARLAAGVARSDDLDARAPYLRIGGSGRIDLARGRIDYTARVRVVEAEGGARGPRWVAGLRGITVPVTLTGPLDATDWTVQWSAVAMSALERKLREAIVRKLGAPR
jgi:AsmA protein